MIRIAMLGTGYVGLVVGACLAQLGNRVVCTDVVRNRIRLLLRGDLPFHEPGLPELVRRNRDEGRLSFEENPARAVADGQVVFIAVGTPASENGAADLSAVFTAAHQIADNTHHGYKLIVQKSTAPAGTARRVHEA